MTKIECDIEIQEVVPLKKVTITYDTPLDALLAIAKRLGQYENKYRMDTEEFYWQYRTGELDCEMDFTEWSGYYQHFLGLRSEIAEQLKDVA